MAHTTPEDPQRPLQRVERVLDSRWMMALAVAAVLVAIVWALVDNRDGSPNAVDPLARRPMATVELLGVPARAEVTLDGREITNRKFGVTPGTRHLLEVRDDEGRSWRQVFLADGSLSLVVELRTHFVEVEVESSDPERASD
jgi:hypothetical protein